LGVVVHKRHPTLRRGLRLGPVSSGIGVRTARKSPKTALTGIGLKCCRFL
jgi:hypothetical protein